MSYRSGGQLAARCFVKGESLAARGFFELLSRWSRLSCQAPQTRKYGVRVLHNGFRSQVKPRFPTPFLSIRACQRRRSSSIPASPTSDVKSPPAEEIQPIEEPVSPLSDVPQEELDSSQFSLNIFKIQSPSTKAEKIEPESAISHELRGIMRVLPSPVVVLTTNAGYVSQEHWSPDAYPPTIKARFNNCRGMTLSSFASVTLSPDPVVTFNIRCPSSTLQAIATCKQFLIHILDASSEGARIANVFTKGNGKEENPKSRRVFSSGVQSKAFNVETVVVTVQVKNKKKYVALPRLNGKGIGKVLRCEILRGPKQGEEVKVSASYGALKTQNGLIAVGDHVLVLGRVVEILDREKMDGNEESKYGLSYADGTYRKAGSAMSPTDEQPIKDQFEEVMES